MSQRLGRLLQELQRQADLEVHLRDAPHVRLLSLHPPSWLSSTAVRLTAQLCALILSELPKNMKAEPP